MSTTAWLWRKYELGYPARYFDGDTPDGLTLWPVVDGGQYPHLNRWESLAGAFEGFVSVGLEKPHACAYSMGKTVEIISKNLVARTWVDGIDAAEIYEFMTLNLLGVWFGSKTPYLVSSTPNLYDSMKFLD